MCTVSSDIANTGPGWIWPIQFVSRHTVNCTWLLYIARGWRERYNRHFILPVEVSRKCSPAERFVICPSSFHASHHILSLLSTLPQLHPNICVVLCVTLLLVLTQRLASSYTLDHILAWILISHSLKSRPSFNPPRGSGYETRSHTEWSQALRQYTTQSNRDLSNNPLY